MEIREGRYYRDRIGHIHGPMERIDDGLIIWSKVGSWMNWYAEGKYLGKNVTHDHDLIEEVTITPIKESEPVKPAIQSYTLRSQNGDEIELVIRDQETFGLCVTDSAGEYCYVELDRTLTQLVVNQIHSWLDCSRFIMGKESEMTNSALWMENGQEHLRVSGNSEDTMKLVTVNPNMLELTYADRMTQPTTVRVRRRLVEQLVRHLQAWLDNDSFFPQEESDV